MPCTKNWREVVILIEVREMIEIGTAPEDGNILADLPDAAR